MRFVRHAAFAAALFACSTLSPASAAPKPAIDPNAPSFVNLDKVLAEYQKGANWTKLQLRMKNQNDAFGQEMKTLTSVRYATDPEKAEALAIAARKPTDKEAARLEDLQKKTQAIEDEFTALSQKAGPSTQESRRLGEISKKRAEAARALEKESDARREKLARLEGELMAQVEADILKVVEKVAKDLKVSYVLNHKVVLYGGNDLTDEVIRKLPK